MYFIFEQILLWLNFVPFGPVYNTAGWYGQDIDAILVSESVGNETKRLLVSIRQWISLMELLWCDMGVKW